MDMLNMDRNSVQRSVMNEYKIDGIVDSIENDGSVKSINSIFGDFQIKKNDSLSELSSLDSYSSKETYSSDESDTSDKKSKKSKKTSYIKKKKFEEIREIKFYSGETVSEFNKDSPFINMLINRRISFCELGPSCHIAAFVMNLATENKYCGWALGKMAIGENSERIRFGNNRLSTHAEMDALRKLDNLFRIQKCKKQKMDLVVIRVNKSGNLCESAPCYHCTKELAKSSVVIINKLYFSRFDGTISCIKFSDWLKNDDFHVSKGWKWMSCCKKY